MAISESVIQRVINDCPLFRVMGIVGERWSFLILRLSFAGVQHFDQFQSILGIARNILADRLSKLVDHDVLERIPSEHDRRRVIYKLTPKGEAFLPSLIALRQWGEVWEPGPVNPVLVDKKDRNPLAPIEVRASDGRKLGRHDIGWADEGAI